MLKLELKRALKRKTFLFAILVGAIFSIVENISSNYYSIINPYTNYPYFFERYLKGAMDSCYNSFLFFKFSPLADTFFTIMPIIVAISYSDSYLEDLNSGFLKNILARCSKNEYLKSKFLANFIVSGITISIPLLISLLMLITTQSSINPDKISTLTLGSGNLNLDMYINHPILYIFMWIGIYFVFAGAISSIALGISIVNRNKFIVLIAPFIIVQAVDILFSFIGINEYNLMRFLYLGVDINSLAMFISFITLLMVTFLPFYFGGKSNEAF